MQRSKKRILILMVVATSVLMIKLQYESNSSSKSLERSSNNVAPKPQFITYTQEKLAEKSDGVVHKVDLKHEQFPQLDTLKSLLLELDHEIEVVGKATGREVYGNIFSGQITHQVESYMTQISQFSKNHEINQICEVGFAGGHSALLFLLATNNTDASYLGFDNWDRSYKETSLHFVKRLFPGRTIEIIKGNSVKSIPNYDIKKTCDVIHIDGAHKGNYPRDDLFHMSRLASKDNLLLIDDCTRSFPAVLEAIDLGEKNNLFVSAPQIFLSKGWVIRKKQKGWGVASYKTDVPKVLTFLGKEFCVPPFKGENCQARDPDATCYKLHDLCHYNDVYGVASVSCRRWLGAQGVEKETWFTRETDSDRNQAHAESFDQYKALPKNLGHVIEIGSGPFTQSKTIYGQAKTQMLSITLNEPMAFKYIEHVKKCFYKNGTFASIPTTIIGTPSEDIQSGVQFDTVVMINVIEHVYDAFTILEKTLNLLKPGGILIWHERLWNSYKGKASSKKDREFALHPIRLKNVIANLIMEQFETLFFSDDTAELRRLRNDGVYFIGRRKQVLPESKLPKHEKCIKPHAPNGTDIVFIVSENNVHQTKEEYIVNANKVRVKSVSLVLQDAFRDELVKYLVSGVENLKLLISHHHFDTWESEASKYINLETSCIYSVDEDGGLDSYSKDNSVCDTLYNVNAK